MGRIKKKKIKKRRDIEHKNSEKDSRQNSIISPKNYTEYKNKCSLSGKKKRNVRATLKTLFKKTLLFLICILLASFSVLVYLLYSVVTDSKSFSPAVLQPPAASEIFDRDGETITRVHKKHRRREIAIDQVSEHVIEALVAVEDRRFYQHSGVDLYAVARAFWANLKEKDWSYQGGSTITQQLARNAYLSQEQTLRRKVQEIWLALQIERYYTKEEILENYLNYIYFGEGAYGIEEAAAVYFGKGSSELNRAESALLAGIIRAPSYYSPFNNPEAAFSRQQVVLSSMYDAGFISKEKWKEEKESRIVFNADAAVTNEVAFPFYVDYVVHHELIEILLEKSRYTTRDEAYDVIYNDGLKVYTTIDTELQQAAEEVLANEDLYPETLRVDMNILQEVKEDYRDEYPQRVFSEQGIAQPQSAVVIADPQSGGLLTLVGGRDYSSDSSYLRYLSQRQPGSAIKPILAYAPAFQEKGVTPGTVIDDSPIIIENWVPENFNRSFRGLTTVREALIYSLNIPAVRIFNKIGPQNGLDFGKKMGLTSLELEDAAASVLGGISRGITPKEMAQAYAVLANSGVKKSLHAVYKVEDRNGQIIYQRERDPQVLLKQKTAYMMNDILTDVVQRGTGRNIQSEFPLAAKTGSSSENRDAWVVVYSPDIVISFWMGHDFQRLGRISDGSGSAVPFINEIIPHVEEKYSLSEFEKLPTISDPINICKKSGLLPGEACPQEEQVKEIFPIIDVPSKRCELHVEKEVCSDSGKLAGPYCPQEKISRKTFLKRPEYIVTDERWKFGAGRKPMDAELIPPHEECDEHEPPGARSFDFTFSLD